MKDSKLRETNDALYERLVSGDASARDDMIVANTAFARSRADAWIAEKPNLSYLRDDMAGEALLALVEAVDKMKNKGRIPDANATGYLYVAIQNAIGHFVDNQMSLAPDRSQRQGRQRGEFVTAPRQVSIGEWEGHEPFAPDEIGVIELRDQILGCCKTDAEREIVKMREEGYTFREIAAKVGKPRVALQLIIKEIYGRFLAESGLPPEDDE